jgi:hypothetical protein
MQADAPAQRHLAGFDDIEIARAALPGVTSQDGFFDQRIDQVLLHQIGQREVIQDQPRELIAIQIVAEIILTLAVWAPVTATTRTTTIGAREGVGDRELVVAT